MKDAKGHGSNARGDNSVDAVYSSKAGVGGLGNGMYARLHSGQQLKLNPAATDGRIPSVGSTLNPSQHTPVPAHSEGVAAVGQPGFNLRASAYENPKLGTQDHQEKVLRYNGSNSKAAVNWGIKKAHDMWPDHRNHSVEVMD
jgi:hypothetical protein